MKRPAILLCTFCLSLYGLAFVVVHRSYTLRRPAINMNYWYYSDNEAVEGIEFYGFWPLRQAMYQFGWEDARHNRERKGDGLGFIPPRR